MDVKTKLTLMKHTDSYWTLLPSEIRELIIMYKESQERIEWRKSEDSRALCQQIILYRQLQCHWSKGPIRCQCVRMKDEGVIEMRVYAHYWDLRGVKKNIFMGYDLQGAIDYSNSADKRVTCCRTPISGRYSVQAFIDLINQ